MVGILNLNTQLTSPDPRLQKWIDYPAVIAARSEVVDWFVFRRQFMTLSTSNAISQLTSRKGNGNNLFQSTDATRPIPADNTIHGYGSGFFSGAQVMGRAGTANPTSAFTTLVVFRAPSDALVTSMTLMGSTANDNIRLFVSPTTGALNHQVRNTTLGLGSPGLNPQTTGYVKGQWSVAIGTFNGAAGSVGVKLGSGALITQTLTGFSSILDNAWYAGAASTSLSSPVTGDIAEILRLNVDMYASGNEALRTLIESYMSAAYLLDISIPGV